MFNDGRSKSLIFLSHCILNQNAKMDGTAAYPGPIPEIVSKLADKGIGIIQMPCPELLCLGMTRKNENKSIDSILKENTRIRRLMNKPEAIERMEGFIKDIILQITEYKNNGFQIKGIIGADRSPTCGVNITSDNNQEVVGQGIFISELIKSLRQSKNEIKIFGIKAYEPEDIKDKLQAILS